MHENPAGENGDNKKELILLYRSYSRVNTDFLKETLKSAGIPHVCHLKGGLLGRGMEIGAGFFNSSSTEDALFFVPKEHFEQAEQIKIQVVGEDEETK